MMRVLSRRRVTIAAAGLTLSAAAIMGCGRARGEPATAEAADSAAAANVAVNAPATGATGDVRVAPSTSTAAPETRASRSSSYEVSPVPSDRPTRVRTRVRAADRYASADVTVDDSRTSAAVTTTDVTVAPGTAAIMTTTAGAPMSEADRAKLAGSAAVTACFANDDKVGLEYPSARLDAMPTDEGNTAVIIRRDSNMVSDQSMAHAEVSLVPSDRAVATADVAMTPASPVTAEVTSGRIVPCMNSGDKSGRAAGGFVNDAQIAHVRLLTNTIDSAVSVAAARRASNPAVREYAEMMIRDHTAANQKESALFEQLRINPAENDISNAMLSEVSVLTAGMNTPSSAERMAHPMAEARVTTTAPVVSASADRDTLHLNNRFVAAANMQPWTSMLAGIGDTTPKSDVPAVTASATMPATMPATTTATVSTFDRKYIDYMVNFHTQVLDGLDTRLIPWAGPELRALLEETRPRVAAHLERARELQRSLQ